MARKRYEPIPSKSPADATAGNFPGKEKDVTFDTRDPINDKAFEWGDSYKYTPENVKPGRTGSQRDV